MGRFGFWIGVLAGGGAAAVMAHAAGAEDLGYTLGAATALFLAADLGLRAMRWVFRAGHPVLGVAGAVLDEAIRRNLVRWMIAILGVVVAALGMLQMATPYVLFAHGVRTVSAQEASLLCLCEPVLNPLWVWLAWGEPAPRATLIGGGLIVTGLVMRYTVLRPPVRTPSEPA